MRTNKLKIILALALAGFAAGATATAQTAGTNSVAWLTQPLSLIGALNTALQQNAAILKGKNDLEASYGIVVQTRAVALPRGRASGQYKRTDRNVLENFPFPGCRVRRTRIGTRACKSSSPFTTAEN